MDKYINATAFKRDFESDLMREIIISGIDVESAIGVRDIMLQFFAYIDKYPEADLKGANPCTQD